MSGLPDNQGSSTRPYLLRALHEWCTDNGFTPYIAVHVDAAVQVPMEHVKNNEIVLNIGIEATSGLKLGNEAVEFRARFGGVSRDIVVPLDHVVAIYARENGQGMAFPMPSPDAVRSVPGGSSPLASVPTLATAPKAPRLTAVDSPAVIGAPTEAVGPQPPPDDPGPGPGPGNGNGSGGGTRPTLKRIK